MDAFRNSLVIGAGAAIGANLRYGVGLWFAARFKSELPWHTLVVNVSGALLLGAVLGSLQARESGQGWRLLLGVGLAGGYTTFSAFAAEALSLIEENRFGLAAAYTVASVVLCVGACWVGTRLGRLALPG